MEQNEFLDRYEKILQDGLVKLCTGAGLLKAELLQSPDVDAKWELYIKDYISDAVVNFNEFPEAAIAFAAYLGLGVAYNWDKAWKKWSDASYKDYYGKHGFDDMDEHIVRDIMGIDLESAEARKLKDTFISCATAALGLISHEGIETQTSQGFYVLARTYSVMYKTGAAISLNKLGYKRVAVNI